MHEKLFYVAPLHGLHAPFKLSKLLKNCFIVFLAKRAGPFRPALLRFMDCFLLKLGPIGRFAGVDAQNLLTRKAGQRVFLVDDNSDAILVR